MSILDRFRLDNRVALVTGGSKGLGKQMALALSEAGAQVAIVSRHLEETQAVAQEIQTSTGTTARGYSCDLTKTDTVEPLVAQVMADFGQVDILINNAGINIRRPIEELTLEEFRQVQDTNVTGPWLLCRALSRHFKERHYGRVINVGSTLSIISIADRSPYATSKGGILQMTRTLALEWAPYGVTANCIMPGPFGTEMNQSLLQNPQVYQDFIAKIPLGRWGDIEEIGGIAVFLASDASSFITGAGITIDGGWTVQ